MTHIALIISIIFGIAISFFFKNLFCKTITFGLVLSICVPLLFPNQITATISFFCAAIMAILMVIFGFKELKNNKLKQISVISLGLLFIVTFVFKFFHYPFATYINNAVKLPFLLYLIAIITDKQHFTKEISFMIIWLPIIFLM
ncbi:MAG: hypothetical protein LBR81_07385 [Prevotellaceae bacterium]|jgi:hypothetical protein|nr:hypothetical protein [Prevotellaceae bacterium]